MTATLPAATTRTATRTPGRRPARSTTSTGRVAGAGSVEHAIRARLEDLQAQCAEAASAVQPARFLW